MLTVNLSNQTSWILRKIITVVSEIRGWSKDSTDLKFSMKKVYILLSGDCERVRWKRLISNNQAALKSRFILWLALHNRLATVDRLSIWGVECDTNCC